jgi:hypothetical protein
MKSLREYIAESEHAYGQPVRGDNFAINIREECLLETYVCDETDDGIVLHADDRMIGLLESYGLLGEGVASQLGQDIADAPVRPIAAMEQHDQDPESGEYDYEGDMAKDDLETIVRAARRLTGMLDDNENMPEWVQSKINKAADYVDTAADYIESNQDEKIAEGVARSFDPQLIAILKQRGYKGPIAVAKAKKWISAVKDIASKENLAVNANDIIMVSGTDPDYDPWVLYVPKLGKYIYNEGTAYNVLTAKQVVKFTAPTDDDQFFEGEIDEAKYQGREVPLGKPMAGDVKKSKVYVKGPKGNVVKVNFGQKGMKIKKSIPGRRKNFRARHNCDNPGPRWKARYWSCRAW